MDNGNHETPSAIPADIDLLVSPQEVEAVPGNLELTESIQTYVTLQIPQTALRMLQSSSRQSSVPFAQVGFRLNRLAIDRNTSALFIVAKATG